MRLCALLLLAALTAHGAAFKPLKTKLIRGGDKPQKISVDVTGVNDLYLAVTVGGDNYGSDQAIWAVPTLHAPDGHTMDLTNATPHHAQVGWGKLSINKNQKGAPLQIPGKSYKTGFWAHGPSMLHFQIDGQYVRFTAEVGLDKGAGRSGSVEFIVTNVPPKMPTKAAYTKGYNSGGGAPAKTAIAALPADKSPHTLNPEGAQALLRQGVEKLVFVRRFTLTANHVYTEYLNSRWTPGGGLCILNLKTGAVRDLVPEFRTGVVNRFDLSYDGTKIVFDYKKSAEAGYRIYEVNVDGSGLKPLTFPEKNEAELVRKYGSRGYHHGTDDLHPCYLPDVGSPPGGGELGSLPETGKLRHPRTGGGIVFTSTRCQYGILCNAGDVYTTKVLYRMDGDGKNMRALSNSPVSEASPAVLPDGRILYHRWEYVDKAAGNLKCLWSMNPDGTGTAEVYGNTITFPETMIYPRPIPGAPGKIVMLGTSHCCPNNAMGAVIVIDTSDDTRSKETMKFVTPDIHALAHTGFHFANGKGGYIYDKSGTKGRLFKDPYPLSEDLFIATRKPKGPAWNDAAAYDLVLLDAKGNETPLYKDDAISCWHPYPLLPRTKPPVIAATTDPKLAEQGRALCVVTDVYMGMDNVERGTIKHLRVLEEVPRPWAVRKTWFKDDRDGMAHSALGDDILGLKVQHGIVPVEADGSAHFTVPALRNIYFQALDANLLAVQTERTYVHYMPGEKRSCIGCHETPNRTQPPETTVPLALKRGPSVPAAQPGEAQAGRLFDYDRQIQPIWDKHCLSCHDKKKPQGGLNLCGDPDKIYSVSYYNLIKLSKGPKQLLGNRKCRNEDAGSAGIEFMPPYALGAQTSPLAAMLSGGRITLRDPKLQAYVDSLAKSHKDMRVSAGELLQVTNWLDVNCQFHPSYWGRLNAKYAKHANYRPAVTFEEALMRTVPKSVQRAEAAAGKVSAR
ncbi:NPCBM/NEW2 domain-containing protein [bacterium]|nr:NPCBM/NEW2 domain-containing protein [bacterium]